MAAPRTRGSGCQPADGLDRLGRDVGGQTPEHAGDDLDGVAVLLRHDVLERAAVHLGGGHLEELLQVGRDIHIRLVEKVER
jgi:hypothetical protein